MTNKNRKTLYIGVTNDLCRRIYEHKTHLIKNSFTDKYNLEYCIYYEEFPYFDLAIQREKELKKWNRQKKEDLINKKNPEWKALVTEKGFVREKVSFFQQVNDLVNELEQNREIPSVSPQESNCHSGQSEEKKQIPPSGRNDNNILNSEIPPSGQDDNNILNSEIPTSGRNDNDMMNGEIPPFGRNDNAPGKVIGEGVGGSAANSFSSSLSGKPVISSEARNLNALDTAVISSEARNLNTLDIAVISSEARNLSNHHVFIPSKTQCCEEYQRKPNTKK